MDMTYSRLSCRIYSVVFERRNKIKYFGIWLWKTGEIPAQGRYRDSPVFFRFDATEGKTLGRRRKNRIRSYGSGAISRDTCLIPSAVRYAWRRIRALRTSGALGYDKRMALFVPFLLPLSQIRERSRIFCFENICRRKVTNYVKRKTE